MLRERTLRKTEVIDRYTNKQAIEDGTKILIGEQRYNDVRVPITTTSNLWHQLSHELRNERLVLVAVNLFIDEGMRILQDPDEKDTDYLKLRVLPSHGYPLTSNVWFTQDSGGFTLLLAEDY